jgi:hypothetical protein
MDIKDLIWEIKIKRQNRLFFNITNPCLEIWLTPKRGCSLIENTITIQKSGAVSHLSNQK